MKNFFVHILLIAICSALAELHWSWWIVVVVSFLILVFTRTKPGRSFLAGFIGVALSWLVIALWEDIANNHILSTKMATLFGLPGYPLFIAVIVLIGGIAGGMGGVTASYVRRIV